MSSISRAQFLRGDWRGEKPECRPPWALPEPVFSSVCDGCGECVTACNEKIIRLSARKRPRLDFYGAGCTFCGDCASACDAGAFLPVREPGVKPWGLMAEIGEQCLAANGTYCMSCREECEYDAILARPMLGGFMRMRVDESVCTGCGMCVSKCPISEIKLVDPG